MDHYKRRLKQSTLEGSLLALLVSVMAFSASASAGQLAAVQLETTPFDPFMVAAYASEHDVTPIVAERRLRIQSLHGVVEHQLRARLTTRFGGISWHPETESFTLYVTDDSSAETAKKFLAEHLVTRFFGIEVVEHSWQELVSQQHRLSKRIASIVSPHEFVVDVDTASNAVSVHIAAGVGTAELREIEDVAADGPIAARVSHGREIPIPNARACTFPHCSTPLRGGVSVQKLGATFSGTPPGHCTAGFMSVLPTDYSVKYLVTAGHCMFDDGDPSTDESRWKAYMRSVGDRQIGYVGQWFMDGRGDLARIRVQDTSASPNWYTSALLGRTQAWSNVTPERPLRGWVSSPAVNSFYCRYGQRTSYSCGTVTVGARCAPVSTGQGVVTICNAWDGTATAAPGDSGGPATGYGDIAYGVLSGGDASLTRFTNIDGLQSNLGVWVIWETA